MIVLSIVIIRLMFSLMTMLDITCVVAINIAVITVIVTSMCIRNCLLTI